jgi:hypothetical protein
MLTFNHQKSYAVALRSMTHSKHYKERGAAQQYTFVEAKWSGAASLEAARRHMNGAERSERLGQRYLVVSLCESRGQGLPDLVFTIKIDVCSA